MIFKPLYRLDMPSFKPSDAGKFSDDRYRCVRLYLTRHGKPVALREFKTDYAKECHWQVVIGITRKRFLTYMEAVDYCKKHFYDLDGKPFS